MLSTIPVYVYIIWGILNIVTFLLFGIDKRHARRALGRIPESTLMWLAIFGGSIGAWAGIYTFHHKTHHRLFTIGMPIIIVLQIVLAIYMHYLFTID